MRTPSQYLQEAIGRSLCKDGRCFYFSGLPLNGDAHRGDLLLLQKALAYSDPRLFYERAEQCRREGHTDEAQREELFGRYVRMILLLSSTETAHIPAADKPQQTDPLSAYIRQVVHMDVEGSMPGMRETQMLLDRILQVHGTETELLDKRSCWYRWLSRQLDPSEKSGVTEETAALAEAMVDLCYCYALEESIPKVTRHFAAPETFEESFLAELRKYWKDFTVGIHVSHVLRMARGSYENGEEPPAGGPRLPDWPRAAAVMELCRDGEEAGSSPYITLKRAGLRKLVPKPRPEKDGVGSARMEARQQEWFQYIRGQLYAHFLFALVGLLLFVAVEGVVNVLQDRFQSAIAIPDLPDPAALVLVPSIISILLFSAVSSALENTFHIPDILDSFQFMGKIIRIRSFMKSETAGRRQI